ncbi:hypothetical protein [Paracoccus sulfuroxidans]|uniref:hypothetical protein n=1 Tax=Paracoccus sulfuroxidans TaxID=384678 RepID=UPI00119D8F2C|nr:hypothetical protein [Paracoccus sulfuroxidans]
MEHRTPIYKLVALWPCRADLAADLSTITGAKVSVDRVHKWAKCGAVPSSMQAHFLRAAQKRGFDLTAEEVLDIHAAPTFQPPEDAA